jgi:sialic acid synthase SpsE
MVKNMKLRNERELGLSCDPYFIAELNSSHLGKIDLAFEMIEAAKESGVDCVKFQSWSESSLYSKTYYQANPIAKRFVKKFSLSPSELRTLGDFCNDIGISFSSTPYSEEEVDFLVDQHDVPFIKIASMEINNHNYLDYIARKNVPIILSTGMADMEEVDSAVEVIMESGNENIALLHCVSIYPAPEEEINLNNIPTFLDKYPSLVIGYSDHTTGLGAPVSAIALGARIIERHFTLDPTVVGMDNQMATSPSDMERVIKACKESFRALGDYKRSLSAYELDQRLNMRRSLVAKCDMKEGEVLTKEKIVFKRPGNGIPPTSINNVIGMKLTKAIESDEMITVDYLDDKVDNNLE